MWDIVITEYLHSNVFRIWGRLADPSQLAYCNESVGRWNWQNLIQSVEIDVFLFISALADMDTVNGLYILEGTKGMAFWQQLNELPNLKHIVLSDHKSLSMVQLLDEHLLWPMSWDGEDERTIGQMDSNRSTWQLLSDRLSKA